MGSALIQGWMGADLLERAEILDPEGIPDSLSHYKNLFHVKQGGQLDLQRSDLVILAVKPQIMDLVCAGLKEFLPDGLPVLSIAAGKSISYFQTHLPDGTPLIRTMPNTPAAIGRGMTALYATDNVTDGQKAMAEALMSAVGKTLWMDDEEQMNAVTAVSGSGPAYVFYLIEALAAAGEKVGLSAEQSMTLARQTVIGAAALAEDEKTIPAAMLRRNVTSPGGTTEAALDVLMNGEFQELMDRAILAAKDRGTELSD